MRKEERRVKLDYCSKDEQSDNFFNFLITKKMSECETLINLTST